jgi:hypothetical protein
MTAADKARALTREDLLAPDWAEVRPVEAWGGTVHVRAISAHERLLFSEAVETVAPDAPPVRASLERAAFFVAVVLCDPEGAPFADLKDRAGVEELAAAVVRRDQAGLSAVMQAAMQLNGMTVSEGDGSSALSAEAPAAEEGGGSGN